VVLHNARITSANAMEIIAPYDIVVDGTDNFPTRYLTNDACVLLGKPNVYGSILRFEGQASVFAPKLGGPCYRCLFPEPPPPGMVPSCAEGGVLGVLPGIIGTIQATEILKLALGQGISLVGRLLLFNALEMKFKELKLRRDPECPVCGDHPTQTTLIDYEQFCGVPSMAEGATHAPESVREFEATVEELKDKIDRKAPLFLLDVREPNEYQISRIPGAVLIPLGQLPNRLSEIPKGPDAPEIIVHCKMGGRSAKAVAMMREQGFTRIKNLVGGILAWSDRIDPSQPKY
jgi:adenylyltransferase/sulfurtransferase